MKTLLWALAFATTAMAQTVTLTMDEAPPAPAQPAISGLAVTKGGITFTFADTAGATYNTPNGGNQLYTQDPVIEGTTVNETVGVTFSVPVTYVRFGMTISRQGTGFKMGTVSYFNGATLVLTQGFNATLSQSFSEAQVLYFGAPVTKMSFTFDPVVTGAGNAFGFDNLIVSTTGAGPFPSVPTASTTALAIMTVLMTLLAGFTMRKQFGAA